jgi:hypothetical protein
MARRMASLSLACGMGIENFDLAGKAQATAQ